MGRSIGVLILAATLYSIYAQPTGPIEVSSRILDRGPHHIFWETVWEKADPGERPGLTTNQFVQIATSLNRFDSRTGDWAPAVALWEATDEGFIIARQTGHQIILAANLNTEGAADVLTASGVRLRATPLGLMYVGASEEPAVVLANLKDCVGEQMSDTDVIYRDAFDSLLADVRFRLGLDRLETDVILREALPPPEAFGLDRRSTRLVVVTEFFDSVTPVVLRETTVGESSDAGPALVDEWLGFGDMEMVPGRAFALDGEPMTSGVPVGKSWQQDHRSLLFETVEYTKLEPLLDALPAYDQARLRSTAPASLAGNGRRLPAPSLRPRAVPNTLTLASVIPRRSSPLPQSPGVVLDWALLTSQTSVTLAGNLTYRVSGSVNVQNLTVEGGSVVKYDPAGSIYVSASVACRTGPYRPAFFTSVYDATVGESVATGDPTSGYYGNPMLRIYPDGVNLEYLRFRHAQWALSFELQGGPNTHYLRHAQFVRCQTAVGAYGPSSSTPQVFYSGNLLFANVGTAFTGYLYQGTVEHLTANGINLLANGSSYYGNSTLNVKNSILANVTTLLGSAVSLSGSYNGLWNSPTFGSPTFPVSSNPFLTVGAGAHYLGFLSPFWNKGSSSIDADLATALKGRTVNPPLERTASFTQDTILAGYAQRDSDTPDLGYHYEPLDFCWTGLSLNNSTLTLTNGVAIGLYGAAGLQLQAGAKLTSQGSPNALNRIVRPVLVQEQYSGAWLATPSDMAFLKVTGAYSPRPEVRMRFTELAVCSVGANQDYWLDCCQTPRTQPSYPLGIIALTDCQLWGTRITLCPGWSGMTVPLTNNLLYYNNLFCDQKRYYGTQPFSLSLFNNLFYGRSFSCHYSDPSVPWTIRDNFFDRITINVDGSHNTTNSNNGYHLTTAVLPGGTGNRTVTVTPSYETGSLGRFYYPATGVAGTITYELVERGSRTAIAAGLFHHTTKTAHSSKDTLNVDIGFHYAATTSNKVPTDVDVDGLADWVEDGNGDGATTGETFRFNNADSDGDGLGDLQEYELQWNVLVNDPAQDYLSKEANSQWQPKVVALGDSVVVAFWDSNDGVYGLGSIPPSPAPRMVSWSVSRNGGTTFEDRGLPPLLEGVPYGDAGDPVPAIDRVSGTIYLVATSERHGGDADNGVPLWKSTDMGGTFVRCPTVLPGLDRSDYPWIAVDDWPVVGQQDVYHDVYISMWSLSSGANVEHTVSRNGGAWVDLNTFGDGAPRMPQIVVGSDHTVYAAWFESSVPPQLRMCTFTGRGASKHARPPVVNLTAPYDPTQPFWRLYRNDNPEHVDDFFKAFTVPALAVNPSPGVRNNDLYVVYADAGQNPGDRADVYLMYSKDAGATWSTKQPVSSVVSHDQWMPMVAIKPDGNQLFIAWNDRRNTGNTSIDVFGRFGTIDATGNVTLAPYDFQINTVTFPPAFPGVLAANRDNGDYDPVWPPPAVHLEWYEDWDSDWDDWWRVDETGPELTLSGHNHEHGEHNGIYADAKRVYFVWSDNRSMSPGTANPLRNQSDIYLARISWPMP